MQDFKNFVTYVCKAYKGHLKLKACKSLPQEINLAEKANSIQPVCNVSEAKKKHGSPTASWMHRVMEPPALFGSSSALSVMADRLHNTLPACLLCLESR